MKTLVKKIVLLSLVFNLKAELIVVWPDYEGGQTLYDTVTGLYWQDIPDNADATKKQLWGWSWTSDPASIRDSWWDNFGNDADAPIKGANAVCVNKKVSSRHDRGYWRVPNYNELNSIVDRTRGEPEPAIRKEFKYVAKGYYWSSTTSAEDSSDGWAINFYYGDDEIYSKSERLYIRCVH